MVYLSIRNWSEYQHYKDRRPPWIKLHRSLLGDYHFTRLQDASKLLAVCLMLLAAETDNHIPADPAWVRSRCFLESDPDFKPLLDMEFIVASEPLADCKQDAMPETEKRQRQRREEKTGGVRFAPPSVGEVQAYISERGHSFDAEAFVAFYASKGWKVGSAPMKDWRAACVTWEKRRKAEPGADPYEGAAYE